MPVRIAIGSVMVIVGALVLAAAVRVSTGASCSVPLLAYHNGTLFLNDRGRITRVRVQIADTAERQEIGLMCRPSLEPDAGMLFAFPVATETSFWMKNTLIPLSIAFIDARWRIIRILEMPVASDPTADDPSKFPLYRPERRYCFALEVNAGFFTSHDISDQAEVRFVPQDGGPLSCAGGDATHLAPASGRLAIPANIPAQRIVKPALPPANTAF